MKTYRVIYVPPFREDKEWMDVQASSIQEVKEKCKNVLIVRIEEHE